MAFDIANIEHMVVLNLKKMIRSLVFAGSENSSEAMEDLDDLLNHIKG